MSAAQRNSVTNALNLLGDNDHPNPSHRNHRVSLSDDCIIYEGDFIETNIDEDAIDALLATALSVDVSTVSHAVYLSGYGRVAVFEQGGTLYCRIIYHDRDTAFGNHDDSRVQAHLYKGDRDAAVVASYTGVPRFIPDYDLDVGVFWTLHPYNTANPYRITSITSPATVIDVEVDHAGDLQAAINAVGAGGAKLVLGSVYYSGEYLVEGKGDIHFIGQGQGVTKIRELRLRGDSSMADSQGYIFDLKTPADPGHAAAIAIAQNIPRNYYFKDLTFDGNGIAVTHIAGDNEDPDEMAIHMRGVEDVLFENVTWQNYGISVDTPAHGPVVGHLLIDNIWAINCTFNSDGRTAWWLDGVHNSGLINCTFADVYGDQYINYFTHDDVTEDINENGVLDPDELRPTQYMVIYRTTFTNVLGFAVMNGHMGHALILDTDLQGRWQSNPIVIVGRSCSDSLPGVYDHTDVQVASCTIGRIDTYLMKLDSRAIDNNVTDGIIGQAIILNNTIGDTTGFDGWIEEQEDFEGQVIGPHVLAENTP